MHACRHAFNHATAVVTESKQLHRPHSGPTLPGHLVLRIHHHLANVLGLSALHGKVEAQHIAGTKQSDMCSFVCTHSASVPVRAMPRKSLHELQKSLLGFLGRWLIPLRAISLDRPTLRRLLGIRLRLGLGCRLHRVQQAPATKGFGMYRSQNLEGGGHVSGSMGNLLI